MLKAPEDKSPLQDKVIKELGYGMGISNQTDIAFVAMWVSRRADGSLTSTLCEMANEELTDELKQKIANVLRELANRVENKE